MSRFILIDNWLESVGGHNYQYATEILQAAKDSGYHAVLATSASFKPSADTIATDWDCYPIFRYAWNRTHTVGVDGKRTEPIDLEGRPLLEKSPGDNSILTRYKQWSRPLKIWDRRRRIRAFTSACRQLFNQLGFDSKDIVFLPSVSDFDFLGLINFLRTQPETQKVHWHVQFHYDIFDGRPPEFESQQQRKDCMQRQFSTALSAVTAHKLKFYATTPQIADQYNRLEVGSFHALPYPISSCSNNSEPTSKTAQKPLRVTLAGAPRREKGKRALTSLFDQLCHRNMLGKDLQLWIQGAVGQIRRQLPGFQKDQIAACDPDTLCDADVVVAPHPLGRKKYLHLIQKTDIGLLPYNNARYHARASGVLIEMLSAGVPVIVTAGSWLSLQLAEPIYQHLDQIFNQEASDCQNKTWPIETSTEAKSKPRIDAEMERNSVFIRGAMQPTTCSMDVPAGTGSLFIRFAWREKRPGYFVRLRVVQLDSTSRELSTTVQAILGRREGGKWVSSVLPIDPQTHQVRIEMTNAYHEDTIQVGIPQVTFLKRSSHDFPVGAVGLIASDLSQIPDLLCEIVRHHDHYKASAVEHATAWNFDHAPLRTLEILQVQQNAEPRIRGAA